MWGFAGDGTMIVFGRRLHRDGGSATGLSFVAGRPVESVDDLPGHAVAVHRFPDAQGAVCFVAGLGLGPRSDRVAATHETGCVETNRLVVVAFLDEPRRVARVPEGAVDTVEHLRTTLDRDAAAAAVAGRVAAYEREAAAHDRRTAPLEAALVALGYGASRNGGPWVRVTGPDDDGEAEGAGVVVDVPERGPMRVRQVARAMLAGAGAHADAVRRAIRAFGPGVTADGTLIAEGVSDAEGVAAAMATFAAAREAGAIALATAREQEFRAGVRMNVARARLVEGAAAGWGGGPPGRVSREDVAVLERVGWLRRERHGLVATDAGLSALAAHRAATRVRVRAHRSRRGVAASEGAAAL